MTTRENTPGYISEQLGTLVGKPLTPSELRVLGALLAGHVTRHSIADALNISHRTVGTHIDRIYRKAGAPNMSAVILMVAGITPCGPALSEARRRWRRQYYQIDAAA